MSYGNGVARVRDGRPRPCVICLDWGTLSFNHGGEQIRAECVRGHILRISFHYNIYCGVPFPALPPGRIWARTFAPCFLRTPPRGGSPCMITRPSPPSGWPEDFHLQAAKHAQHTTRRLASRSHTSPTRGVRASSWSNGRPPHRNRSANNCPVLRLPDRAHPSASYPRGAGQTVPLF